MDTLATAERSSGTDRISQVHRLPDRRAIGYAEYGDPDGLPAIALHGTPGARFMFALTDAAARARGLRIIAPERPGYGLSDTHHFDTLAETSHDVQAIADALGLGRFVLIGVSGGGPHAVAAAALLRDRALPACGGCLLLRIADAGGLDTGRGLPSIDATGDQC